MGAQGTRRRPWRALLLVCVAVLAVPVLGLAGLFAFNALTPAQPVVGMRLAGADTAALWAHTDKTLDEIAADRAHARLAVVAGDQRVSTAWADLGIRDDPVALAAAVRDAGRSGSILDDLVVQATAPFGAQEVTTPPAVATGTALADFLGALAARVDRPATDAAFALTPEGLEVATDRPGWRLDVEEAERALTHLDPLAAATVALRLHASEAPLTAADLTPLLTAAERVIGAPLVVEAAGQSLTLEPEALLAAVTVTDAGAAGSASLAIDPAGLGPRLDEFALSLAAAPVERVLRGTTVVQEGAPGRSLDTAALGALLQDALTARLSGQAATGPIAAPVTEIPAPEVHLPPTQASFGSGHVYLTFDDGPGYYTDRVLDILAAHGAPATFYVLGQQAERFPAQISRMAAEGHRIANHSYDHADLTTLDRDGIAWQIGRTQEIIAGITGVAPTGFRPPYGAVNGLVREVVAADGLSMDLWTIDPKDWQRPGAAAITDRVLSGVQPGSVILLHVQHPDTIAALPAIIDGIRAAGYTLG